MSFTYNLKKSILLSGFGDLAGRYLARTPDALQPFHCQKYHIQFLTISVTIMSYFTIKIKNLNKKLEKSGVTSGLR